MMGSEAKGRAYASQMPVPGERRFIKRDHQSRARGSCRGRGHEGAGSRPKRHLTCNQALVYIRGPGPLVYGIRSSSSFSSPNSSRSTVIDTIQIIRSRQEVGVSPPPRRALNLGKPWCLCWHNPEPGPSSPPLSPSNKPPHGYCLRIPTTIGAHHGAKRSGERSQVLAGIPFDPRRKVIRLKCIYNF
jgi:hypothetical protein